MFEQWVDGADSSVRLIVKQGSALPANLGPRDWKLIGPITPAADTAEQVTQKGFCFVYSNDPLPVHIDLDDSNAAGA